MVFRSFALCIYLFHAVNAESCNTANVWADCSDELFVYLKDEDGINNPLQIGHDPNPYSIWTQIISDINASTVIEFECINHQDIGGFIATIQYNNVLHSTTNPITTTNFDIVKGNTSSLVYHTKTSSPWHNHNEYIAEDASWVWNDQSGNSMTFDFPFSNIISNTPTNSSQFTCGCNEDCVIDCDHIDPRQGCSNTVIDARQASSLHILCKSSQNHYYGGCQFSTIYCPQTPDSVCNIQCKDYYGCYLATIYSSYTFSTGGGNVSIECHNEEGSCLKTILYANKSSNVDVSCYGSGILGSKQHSVCDNFNIHGDDVSNKLHLLCSEDYSCYNIYLYANNAHMVSVHARGNLALSTSYIHAENAQQLTLHCGSQQSEYGCYKLYTYNPGYATIGSPRTTVICHGHGCYDAMYFYSDHGAVDMDISLNGCGECTDVTSCISNWYFYCNEIYSGFHGDSCDSTNCDCVYGINMMKTNWKNSVEECDIFTFDYECTSGVECVVDCMKQWPQDHGCHDKAINGKDATGLTVICNSTSTHGACESSHIFCPSGDGARCDVSCNNKDACYDTEISMVNKQHSKLYLKCTNSYACSHTNVYGVQNGDIYIDCIATDSCDNINVTANDAENVTIHCQGNAEYRSYSACDGFNVWANNVTNDVRLVCNGDYSCYAINVFANYAHNVVVDSIGNYGSFGGNIYAQNASAMLISCKSQYNEYGCYKMSFYIPIQATSLLCEGHGCYYVELFALNGYNDLLDVSMNGCGECSSISECVSHWSVQCGSNYASTNLWDGLSCSDGADCGCDEYFTALYQNGWMDDSSQCNLIHPDQSCDDDKACVVDCSDTECLGDVIFGNNATSLKVICGDETCNNAKIYCPKRYHSVCSIECSGSKACWKAQIYGEKDSILDLKCDDTDACDYVAVDISDTFKSTINCTEYDACDWLTVYGENAQHINIGCYGETTGNGYYDYFYNFWNISWNYWNYSDYKHDAVCDGITVHAKYAQFVEINCIGNDVCYPSMIDVSSANNVVINAVGSYSIYSGLIDAKNAAKLSLHFKSIANYEYGVEEVAIYIAPHGNTQFNCIGFGCHDLHLYLDNGMKDVHNISFYGCNECIKPEVCIQDWYLYCGDSYTTSTTFTGSICSDNACNCNELKDAIEETFILELENDEDGECRDGQFKPDIICDDDVACFIDCAVKKCQDKLVYGGKALSLTVNCKQDWSCNWIQIYCPETASSECNLLCTGFDACYDTTVYGDHHNKIYIEASAQYSFEYSTVYGYDAILVNVSCSDQESCYDSSIYASKAKDVDIKCVNHGSDAYDDDFDWYYWYYGYQSSSPCYDLNVYASLVQNGVQLSCDGDYACYAMVLHAQNAKNVFVFGNNGEYGMEEAVISASNATHFELLCIGEDTNRGCSYSNIYLPSTSNSIRCFGFGCAYLYLYSSNGMDALSLSDIELNSCSLCQDESECINNWYIYCDEWAQYDVFAVFDGSECITHAQYCQCQENTQLLQSVFVNSPDEAQCKAIAKTTTTTWFPIIRTPPHNHKHPDHDRADQNNNNGGINSNNGDNNGMSVFVVVISLIVFVCICANITYCYKRRAKDKIADVILQKAEEGGIQEIALEPMDQNIGQQIVVVKEDGAIDEPKQKVKWATMSDEPKDGYKTGTITGVSAFTLSNQ